MRPATRNKALTLMILIAALRPLNTPAQTPASPATAAPCSLSATVSKTEATVGERFDVEVRGSGPAGTEWTFPAEAGNEEVELSAVRHPQPAARPGVQRYDAAAFVIGEAKIPPIRVECRTPDRQQYTVVTPPASLRVASVLPKDADAQKLADIRDPLPLSVGAPFWVALALSVLTIAALAAWLWRRRRRAAPDAAAAPMIAPEEEARLALDQLRQAQHLSRGELRAFYIALTEIAKRYLERRLGAPILEMTTTEVVACLRVHAALDPWLGGVQELMGASDRVKFARGQGVLDEAERQLTMVADMVVALAPKPADEAQAKNKPERAR